MKPAERRTRILSLCAQTVLILIFQGCASSTPKHIPTPNLMEKIWRQQEERLIALQNKRAVHSRWAEGAESIKRVDSIEQFAAFRPHLPHGLDKIEEMEVHIRKRNTLIHYGYEQNYHAIVVYSKSGSYVASYLW
jgi:hypothetical protein